MSSLNDKIALITGSSDGIGAATAILFSSLGAKVAIVGRDQAKLDKVADECLASSPHGYKPVVIKADFLNEDDIKRTFNTTIAAYNKLDILVNNVGVAPEKSFHEPDAVEDYDRVMKVNVRSVIVLTKLASPYLSEANGAIVNVSSVAGQKSRAQSWAYCMSKATLDMFTKTMASALAPNVRVNAVSPGPVKTAFLRQLPDPESVFDSFAEMMPLKRAAEPIEIAKIIAFLSSDDAKNMTGSIVVSDSGYLIQDVHGVSTMPKKQ